MPVLAFLFYLLLSNSFVYNAHNKHQDGESHVNIFCSKAKQLPNRLFPAGIQLLSDPVYSQNPVDHDRTEHGSERHDVDRYHIHPGTHIRLILDEKSDQEHETAHEKNRLLPVEMQMSLNRFRTHLEHVDEGRDSCKQHG